MSDDKQDWRSDGVKEAAKWQAILDSIPVHYTPITPAIFKELLRQRLAMKCLETGLTWAQMAADAAIKRAIETGDIREVADRVDGKVPQPMAVDLNAAIGHYDISADPPSSEEWQQLYGEQRPKIGNGNGSHNSLAPPNRTAKSLS